MRINNNLSAMSAFNALDLTNTSLQKIIHALSTGLRINSSSDDAAGFAISEKMRSQIRGLDTAIRNSQDGISLLQTAEGALSETNSMLSRMRELAVQASNDSLTSNDRQYIQLEIDQLKDQIDRIAETTQFNKKRLLDGSCGALWSSGDLNVNVKINGGLTYIDDYGQKVSAEGNYRIDIRAEAGEAQVQKSNIMYVAKAGIEEEPAPFDGETIYINTLTEATSGEGWNFSNGALTITNNGKYQIIGDNTVTTNHIVVNSDVNADVFMKDVNIDVSNTRYMGIQSYFAFYMRGAAVKMYLDGENSLKAGAHASAIEVLAGSSLTISSASGDYSTNGKLIATGAEHGAGIGGSCSSMFADGGDITILGGTIEAYGGDYAAGIGGGSSGGYTGGNSGNIKIYGGDITAKGSGGAAGIGSGSHYYRSLYNNSGSITIGARAKVNADGSNTSGNLGRGAGIGGGCGFSVASSQIIIDPRADVTVNGYTAPGALDSVGPGQRADDNISSVIRNTRVIDPDPEYTTESRGNEDEANQLSQISQFYNESGTFLISQPQKLTITQGDGQTASITLYETDTMYDVAGKINNVIANTFGNARYTDNHRKFCTISDGTEGTSESVHVRNPIYSKEIYKRDSNGELILNDEGEPVTLSFEERLEGYEINATMLIRSAKPGHAGELHFSGDEDLLKALGLNTIRESSETRYTASIYNAHSGKVIANGIKTTGNILSGIIPNADIEFDSMSGIKTTWDENTKRYIFSGNETYSAFIHLKDNSATFQTGANRGDDFMIQLGDSSSQALGISSVSVITRETASRAITTIDSAINKISSQRAKIGTYENALEHTMTNLTTTSTNLASAESRIRDVDMSKLMLEFVKLQILNQSGTSMLAQANQLPQSVLNLMQ